MRAKRNRTLTDEDIAGLKRLFAADVTAPDYYDQGLLGYELHQKLGWPPHCPTLDELWANPGPPESMKGTAFYDAWPQCREDLMRMHRLYGDSA